MKIDWIAGAPIAEAEAELREQLERFVSGFAAHMPASWEHFVMSISGNDGQQVRFLYCRTEAEIIALVEPGRTAPLQ